MQLELAKIRLDGGTQPRAQLLIEVIDDYAEQMRLGAKFPPVIVFFDGKNYWLADGFHRVAAAHKAWPGGSIEAEVIQGTQTESQWFSYGVNKGHGLRRTNEDKARAVKGALRHPQGVKRSDRDIALHVGVTPPTVGKYRAELGLTVKSLQSHPSQGGDDGPSTSPDHRLCRDGRTINTSNINRNRRRSKDRQNNGQRRSSLKPIQPTIAPSVMERMTALSLPHNPVMGARALLSVFDKDYLRTLVEELIRCLKEDER